MLFKKIKNIAVGDTALVKHQAAYHTCIIKDFCPRDGYLVTTHQFGYLYARPADIKQYKENKCLSQ